MINRKIIGLMIFVLIFIPIATNANFVSNSVDVGDLTITYSTNYKDNILEARKETLRIKIEVKFPSSSDFNQIQIFSFGVKVTNSQPTIRNANNNVYGFNKTDIIYQENIASFSFDVNIDLDSLYLKEGKLYFTPFLEYRGAHKDGSIEMTFVYLPSFSPGEEYQKVGGNFDSDWGTYFLLGGGGFILISIIGLYLNTKNKRFKENY